MVARIAAALPLLAAAVLSSSAVAAPSTTVVSGGVPGPTGTFSEVLASADCGAATLTGGGARMAQTTRIVEHNGLHLDGSLPSVDGVTQAADGTTDPSRWIAAGGAGGGVPSDAQTIASAVCLTAGSLPTTVVVAGTRGPATAWETVRATATCPAGSRLLSGGARTTPGTVGSLKPNGSYPSDEDGVPLLSGTDPRSWTAVGLNGGGGDRGNTTYAFALCAASVPEWAVTVAHAQVPGPALASSAAQTTAVCPAGSTLLGGGAYISDRFGLPGSQGDHLTGSYPSDAVGTPVANGPASAWTAASHTGGVDSGPLTQTDAWALCASDGPAPPTSPADASSPLPPGPAARLPGIGRAIAIDRHGNRYVTGETTASAFPLRNPLQSRALGGTDVFVAKLDRAGRIVWSTYLGGSRNDAARGIAVDRAGAVYVTGRTSSTDFPTTRSARQRSFGGGPFDAFVVKLAPSGRRLEYATYLGDTHYDEANAIVVDARGRATITGRTVSPAFPAVGRLPHARSGAFVARFDRTGSRLEFSTVLGGRDRVHRGNSGLGIALDARGATYVTGVTNAQDFPTTPGALQGRSRGGSSAFVVKLAAEGRRVVYATLLGGRGDDAGRAIAVDAAGQAWVAGLTASRDLPVRGAPPLLRRSRPVGSDAFVAQIGPTGRGLRFAAAFGGSGNDAATGIAVDRRGHVHVVGETHSPDLPLVRPTRRASRGAQDGFALELGPRGRTLVRSTYLGSGAENAVAAVALSPNGGLRVTGVTRALGGEDGVLLASLAPVRR